MKFKSLFKEGTDLLKSKAEIAKKQKDIVIKKVSSINFQINQNPFKFLLEKSQDWLESKVNDEKEEVVLRQSALWAKSVTWTLIGGTTFGIIWLAVAKTEEIVVARGKLEPSAGVVEIQLPIGGVADDILVKEGQKVKKGQVLIELDNEATSAQMKAVEKSLLINREITNRLEPLVEQGAISKVQYLQQQNRVIELESQLVQSRVTNEYQTISSPIEGIVFDLKPSGKGFVAAANEPVMSIVPLDKLIAKIEIESRSIGFVNVGKTADISIDSYPASDFGVIKGKLVRIGSDALPPDPALQKGYRFPAEIHLNQQYLKIKNGKNLPLQVGMSLTANIKLRDVSYLQLLLNTFSEKADSIRQL